MSEMIERVANAMTYYLDGFWRSEDGSIQVWLVRGAGGTVQASFSPHEYRRAARFCDEMNAGAAIVAMREPTKDMIEAGSQVDTNGGEYILGDRSAYEVWTVMHEALK